MNSRVLTATCRYGRGLLFATGCILLTPPGTSAQVTMPWTTLAGTGGGSSQGSTFEVRMTLAQPLVGRMTGGAFELDLGFWSPVNGLPAPACPGSAGDANCDGGVDFFDIDPFLEALFDPAAYAGAFCGGSPCAADVDCSGQVDFFDIDGFLTCVFADCPPCP